VTRRPALLFVVAFALLLVGFVNLTRGLDHPGPAYRPWALHEGSYSDALAMGGDRYLHGDHPVPYVDDRIEYPVVLGVLIWLPSYAPGGQFGYFATTALLLGASLAVALAMLRRIPGANPWLLAATPALATYGLLNWDLVGIALLLAGIVLTEGLVHSRGNNGRIPTVIAPRIGVGGALLGLGVATKLFPVAAFPAMVRTVRRPFTWLTAAAVVVLAVNVPFAIAAFDNWRYFFRFSSARPPDFSVWNAIHLTSVDVVNVLSLGAVALAALAALRYGRTPLAARLGTALVLATWMAFNKVSSPQYSLWIFAAAALVGAPWRVFGALAAGAMFDFVLELWLEPHHAVTLTPAATVMVAVRTAATLWFAWWCWRRLRIEVALDEGAQGGGRFEGDGAGRVADGLDLAR
jgi:hypothetical protein